MPRIFGIDIAGEIHRAVSPGLPSVTLVSIAAGNRTEGNLAGGRERTETSYPCRGIAVENVGQLVGGRMIGEDEAVIMVTAKSIAGGTVAPKAHDKITFSVAGATRTRPIIRVATDPAEAAWLCVVKG